MMVHRLLLLLLLGLAWLPATGGAQAARIVAVGDVHGEIEGFDSVLRAAALIDENARWVGGDAILVQTGDTTDRGSRVRAVLDRLRSLQQQAPAQGGRVVALLGNHEVSNLIHLFDERSTPAEVYHQIWSDFATAHSKRRQRAAYKQWRRWLERYPGCVKQENLAWREDREAWLADHPLGFVEYIEALSPQGEYGRWLRSLGIAEQVGGSLFLHGGLSRQLVLEQGYRSVAALNQTARQVLAQLDADRQQLIDEELIVPFSTIWETHCALFSAMARLAEDGEAEAMALRAELEKLRARLPGMPGWFLTAEQGPLWFRGLANGDETELGPDLEGILEVFGVARIAVGHTPQKDGRIHTRFGDRVYLIDTAMAYPELGGQAAALEIDGDRVTAIYGNERVLLAGGPLPDAATPEEPPPAVEGSNGHGVEPLESSNGQQQPPVDREERAVPLWLDPDGEPLPFNSVQEVLDFLATAKVMGSQTLGTGITLPRKLLLERDGVRAHAIFHTVAIEKRRERLRGGKVVRFFRDHYANNVAAFELSRMLGMSNVPPAVVRKIGRDKGSVQLWIENSKTETERRQEKIVPPGDWRLTAKDMLVFDNLAHNIDRNQGNILYDADWNLWFIDHTRCFSRIKQLPSPGRVRRCSRRLWQALQDLDEEEVRRRLKPYLGIYEIKGLLARRELLIDLIEERIATTGEGFVIFDYDDPLAATETAEPDVPEAPPD
jgi:hypothetical protein